MLGASAWPRRAAPIVYVNQVGGQDELVFDGGVAGRGRRRHAVAAAAQFEEQVLVVDVEVPRHGRPGAGAGAVDGQRHDRVAPAGDAAVAGWPAARPRPRSTRRWCSAPATTSPRTGSPTR